MTEHLGTHFDVMNKEFALEYLERKPIVFDVSKVTNKEISINDIKNKNKNDKNLEKIKPGIFVRFYTGFIDI